MFEPLRQALDPSKPEWFSHSMTLHHRSLVQQIELSVLKSAKTYLQRFSDRRWVQASDHPWVQASDRRWVQASDHPWVQASDRLWVQAYFEILPQGL
jgi:hypothetical protein